MDVLGAFLIGAFVIGLLLFAIEIILGIRDILKWKHQDFMSRINEKF